MILLYDVAVDSEYIPPVRLRLLGWAYVSETYLGLVYAIRLWICVVPSGLL